MYAKILLIQGSFWELMSHASLFAWIIIAILAFMSLVSWGILINKWRLYRGVQSDSKRFLAIFRRRGRLQDTKAKLLAFKRSPMGRLFEEGYREYEALLKRRNNVAYGEQAEAKLTQEELSLLDKVLERETTAQIGSLERNVAFLATTGNVAPFFGLLGTCWGIMYAFLNIGVQKSASLIVVAPGIAEALVATIFGLAVAIPAVMAFNWCNTRLKYIADELYSFSLEFLAAVSQEDVQ